MRLLRLVIECTTPLHCGGAIDEIQDQPVSRDAFGYWRIPGSSLAGSLRALAGKLDPALTARMFGDQDGADSHASLIWCEDGLLLDYNGKPVLECLLAGEHPEITQGPFVRDHVRLSLETGAGEEGGKFDAEIVPAGTRFLLEFRCDGWDRDLTAAELDFFDSLCSQILAGQLSAGGKSSLGYGNYRVIRHEYSDLNLRELSGMAAWLRLPEFGLSAGGSPIELAAAIAPAGSGLDGWLELPLVCNGPVLIGGGSASRPEGTGGEADMIFALTPYLDYEGSRHERWEAVLPASSLRGVFRHAVYAILQDLAVADSEAVLERLFGFVDGDKAQCGKVIVCDSRLEFPGARANYQFEQHVALDRFTGAALDGALFSEEPFWNEGTGVIVRIRACSLEAHEAALFFHAILDLLEGSLAVGSGANRGNGRLCLPGWRQNPATAAAAIRGNLTWNGTAVFTDGLETLEKLAPQWDNALKALL